MTITSLSTPVEEKNQLKQYSPKTSFEQSLGITSFISFYSIKILKRDEASYKHKAITKQL